MYEIFTYNILNVRHSDLYLSKIVIKNYHRYSHIDIVFTSEIGTFNGDLYTVWNFNKIV